MYVHDALFLYNFFILSTIKGESTMADHYDENYEEVVSLPGVDTDGERTENIDDGRIRRPSEFFVRTTSDDIDEQEHAPTRIL